jgi:ferric-dicitrate binding protein FerR (iron transport regulator)
MNSTNLNNRTNSSDNKKDIDKLLDLLFSGENGTDAEMKSVIQGLVESKQNERNTDAGLFDFFNRFLDRKRNKNDKYVAELMQRLQKELNFKTIMPIPIPFARRRSFRVMVVGVAAAVLVAVLVLPKMFDTQLDLPAPVMVAVTADAHEIKEVVLPDSSIVNLREGSTITFPENFGGSRAIKLDGEAFFSVMKDTQHPFTVEAGDVTVTVLGTEFNMKAWADEPTAEVVLASGSVEIRTGDAVEVLKPAEQATVHRTTSEIEVTGITKSEILRVRGINLSFSDVTLDEAFEMIADFYGVRIEASGVPAVDGIVVKMADGATLEQTLFMLQQVNPVFDYTVEDRTVIVRRKQP